jgi:hypothetical protein
MRSVGASASLFALLILSACGGGTGDTVPGDDEPGPPKTPIALQKRTDATQINFQAATGDILLDLVSEEGFCIVNQTTDITAIVGDYRSRPLADVPVAFYVVRGRGLIDEQGVSGPEGTATVTFRSLCPDNFTETIFLKELVRGAERFTDSNSNGKFDEGEFFVDEPLDIFMDSNNNNILEPELGEFMIVDRNGNGQPDLVGNGEYDNDIIRPMPHRSASRPAPPTSPSRCSTRPDAASSTSRAT